MADPFGSAASGASAGGAVGGPWGAAVGGGLGLIGGIFGAGKESDARRAWEKRQLQYARKQRKTFKRYRGKILDNAQGAYEGALADIAGVGRAARQDIFARDAANKGDITQHGINTGLYNTTRMPQAYSQATSMTNRDLGALAERIATLRSQTRLQGAGMYGRALEGQQGLHIGLNANPFNTGPRTGQAEAYGQAGAELGGWLTGIPWGDLFGGGSEDIHDLRNQPGAPGEP